MCFLLLRNCFGFQHHHHFAPRMCFLLFLVPCRSSSHAGVSWFLLPSCHLSRSCASNLSSFTISFWIPTCSLFCKCISEPNLWLFPKKWCKLSIICACKGVWLSVLPLFWIFYRCTVLTTLVLFPHGALNCVICVKSVLFSSLAKLWVMLL